MSHFIEDHKRKKRYQLERLIQISIFDWARLYKIKEGGFLFDYMTASPNGGTRNLIEAVNFKRSGVSAGFPDISIFVPRNNYHGMFLEIKKDGKYSITQKQKDWINKLKFMGYFAEFGIGFDHSKKLIEDYLKSELYANNRV